MRRKIQLSTTMADSDAEHTVKLQELAHDLEVFSSRAEGKALQLHAIIHVPDLTSHSKEAHANLAVNLYAIVGIIVWYTRQAELWTTKRLITRQEVQDIKESLGTCSAILDTTSSAPDRGEFLEMPESEWEILRENNPSADSAPFATKATDAALLALHNLLVRTLMNAQVGFKDYMSDLFGRFSMLPHPPSFQSPGLGEAPKNPESKNLDSQIPDDASKASDQSDDSPKNSGFPQILKGSVPPPP